MTQVSVWGLTGLSSQYLFLVHPCLWGTGVVLFAKWSSDGKWVTYLLVYEQRCIIEYKGKRIKLCHNISWGVTKVITGPDSIPLSFRELIISWLDIITGPVPNNFKHVGSDEYTSKLVSGQGWSQLKLVNFQSQDTVNHTRTTKIPDARK